MHNQHAGLSQLLAQQHITQRRQQAAHMRCHVAFARRAATTGGGRRVAGGSWSGASRRHNQPVRPRSVS